MSKYGRKRRKFYKHHSPEKPWIPYYNYYWPQRKAIIQSPYRLLARSNTKRRRNLRFVGIHTMLVPMLGGWRRGEVKDKWIKMWAEMIEADVKAKEEERKNGTYEHETD